MGKVIAAITILVVLVVAALPSVDHAGAVGAAAVKPGAPAPGFTAMAISGGAVNLGQYAGQIVILEWTPAAAKADLARWRAAPTDYLLDPDGVVGHLYDARATPHMVVIDRSGRIAYMGAIDDTPSTRLADVKTAKNYLVAALDEIAAGKPVTVASTRAYGCSIKYKTS